MMAWTISNLANREDWFRPGPDRWTLRRVVGLDGTVTWKLRIQVAPTPFSPVGRYQAALPRGNDGDP